VIYRGYHIRHFCDNDKRATVRRIVEEAFGLFFVIDPTNLGQLRIRLSDRAPVSEMQEKGIHDDAIKFHAAALLIENASDGVRAFTGIVTELYAGDPKILLVDEPEAFLHPALAQKLGYEISRAAINSDKRVFASTHSPRLCDGMHPVWRSNKYNEVNV
jgi:predicted ATPase